MKLAVIVLTFGALGLAACAPSAEMQRLNQEANHVIVTGTEQIPGHPYEVLGVVHNGGHNWMTDNCSEPHTLAMFAIQQYGSVDGIVDFKTREGTCSETSLGTACSHVCEGTAVRFTES